MLTIQFAHLAVILLPCFCLIYAAEPNSNEKQVSDINGYIPYKISLSLSLLEFWNNKNNLKTNTKMALFKVLLIFSLSF